MRVTFVQRGLVGALTCATILTAPSIVRTQPIQCLPPKNCKTPATCCAFKHDSLLRFQMADARKMRDWFGDPCNSQNVSMSDFTRAADQAEADSTQSSALGAQMNAADANMHNANKTDGTTNPVSCRTTFPPGFDQMSTCKEILDGVRAHEGEHQDFCEMLNNVGGQRAKWGLNEGVKAVAESERRAHAWEYLTLVREYEGARRRCLSSKNQLTPELEAKSKATVRKAQQSYLNGGGKSCK